MKQTKGFLIKNNGRYSIDSSKTPSILLNLLHVWLIEHYSGYIRGYLLDAGCGEKPYSLIYDDLVTGSIGMDVEYCIHDQQDVDVFASIDSMPFRDETFDTVICTNVLEHAEESPKGFSEIARVLKPGGHAIISIPFLYPLHEAPHDFYRFTLHGIRYQIEKNGMEVLHIHPLGGIVFYFSVYFNLFLNKLLKLPVLTRINCMMQNVHFALYEKFCIKKLVGKNISDSSISGIISCGFFAVAVKK